MIELATIYVATVLIGLLIASGMFIVTRDIWLRYQIRKIELE